MPLDSSSRGDAALTQVNKGASIGHVPAEKQFDSGQGNNAESLKSCLSFLVSSADLPGSFMSSSSQSPSSEIEAIPENLFREPID